MNSRGRPLRVARRRWMSIVVVTLLVALAGLFHALTAPVSYRSSASAFFSLTTGSSASDLVQGSTYAQNQVQSFALLATTPAVLQPVVDRLGLRVSAEALAGQLQAQVPVGTVIVKVTATDASAQTSADLANAVISSLSRVVEDIAPKDTSGNATVDTTIVAPAQVPSSPSSPDVPLILIAAVVLGLLLGAGQAWARDARDTRLGDVEALPEVTDRPLIGSITAWEQKGLARPIVATAPHSPQAESFRLLRTNLQFLRSAGESTSGAHVVSVTSALAGEGKSSVAANLAVALAETGATVALVDADLRRPTVARLLGVEGGVGLTTVLAGQVALHDVLQPWGSTALDVLPSGAVPPNPAELLGSPAMRRVVEDLRGTYDYVVLDTAPTLPVADAMVLSRIVDGTIVVAQAGRVRRGQLANALGALEQVSATVLGVVLNRVRREEQPYTYRTAEPGGTARTGGSSARAVPRPAGNRVGSVPVG